jgi:hypothetical protein
MAEFDAQAMIERFRERALAVKQRTMPPVEGPAREQFERQAQQDFMDFAIIGDADATLDDGVLVLRIDLRADGS